MHPFTSKVCWTWTKKTYSSSLKLNSLTKKSIDISNYISPNSARFQVSRPCCSTTAGTLRAAKRCDFWILNNPPWRKNGRQREKFKTHKNIEVQRFFMYIYIYKWFLLGQNRCIFWGKVWQVKWLGTWEVSQTCHGKQVRLGWAAPGTCESPRKCPEFWMKLWSVAGIAM